MSTEWDEYKKVADEKFSEHKAHLLMSNDRFTAIDWRRPGSSDYFFVKNCTAKSMPVSKMAKTFSRRNISLSW